MINYASQFITKDDISSINKILKKKFLTQGPLVKVFEDNISKFNKAKYSVAVNSASSGLLLACKVLNLKKNDIVWTTPNTFAATANAALHCQCKVKFIDIDINTYNICLDNLKKNLILSKKKNNLPKAVIVVHFGGNPCEMREIFNLSKKFKFKVIEDASHALGSKYKKSIIGDCKYSDLSIYSFHPIKIITTAEGGMITTNNRDYYKKLLMLRTNGISRDFKFKDKPWYYEQKMIGYNFRMNEIQSCLGISQLRNLKKWVIKRNQISKLYTNKLKNLPIKLPKIKKSNLSSFHLFVVMFESKKIRDNINNYLRSKKIFCNYLYIPMYRHPIYKKDKIDKKLFKNMEIYYATSLAIPIHIGLNDKKINYIISSIKNFFNEK
tara:strand:- start:809 stop:1951 length:1143 start_codon:yes stop_codon:yes gene_type:complete